MGLTFSKVWDRMCKLWDLYKHRPLLRAAWGPRRRQGPRAAAAAGSTLLGQHSSRNSRACVPAGERSRRGETERAGGRGGGGVRTRRAQGRAAAAAALRVKGSGGVRTGGRSADQTDKMARPAAAGRPRPPGAHAGARRPRDPGEPHPTRIPAPSSTQNLRPGRTLSPRRHLPLRSPIPQSARRRCASSWSVSMPLVRPPSSTSSSLARS
mmetsp:Transcript_25961/g.60777  ORF Transcript_25961/g.60777 Transcript_25961/m.60777 type:complete len:210 (+) Transcript_25961:128-757(+)